MFKPLFIFLLFFSRPQNLTAQADTLNTLPAYINVDSLKGIYGENKNILKKYESQILLALSYYPGLSNEHIKFKFSEINSTARTTVTFGSIFKKINKHYIIIINDDRSKTGLILSDAPFDAQVSVIGHELAHVTDFKRRGFFAMVWWGLRYLIVKQQTRIEIRADETTIDHELGWPLYYWADFVLNYSNINKHYKKIKETKYLQPDEILSYMSKHKLQ